jgi:hypothetical protein
MERKILAVLLLFVFCLSAPAFADGFCDGFEQGYVTGYNRLKELI